MSAFFFLPNRASTQPRAQASRTHASLLVLAVIEQKLFLHTDASALSSPAGWHAEAVAP